MKPERLAEYRDLATTSVFVSVATLKGVLGEVFEHLDRVTEQLRLEREAYEQYKEDTHHRTLHAKIDALTAEKIIDLLGEVEDAWKRGEKRSDAFRAALKEIIR